MATRRKPAPDPWQVGESVEMSNGMRVTRWENLDTGEVRLVPTGLHPDDQPLTDPAPSLPMVAPDPDIEETATDRVSAMLAQAQGADRAEVNVYRMVNGVREYCRKFRPDEFEDGSFDMLREMFGPGEYELRLYATDPATRKFTVRNLTRIKISEVKTPTRAELPSGLSQVLSTIAQGQERMLTALVEMKQAPQKDPMEEMTRMLGMMTAMREAMGLNQQPQAREKSSIGEIVAAIRELRGAAEELTPQRDEEPVSLMGMLPRVLELVKAGQGAQAAQLDEQEPMPQVASAPVLSPVTIPPSMMDAAPQASNAPATSMPAFIRQVPPSDPVQPTQESDDMNPITLIKLRAYLKQLCAMANRQESVEAGAQFVYDKLPDDMIDLMELDSWWEMLQSVASEVTPHRVWLTNVRDAALAMFTQDDQDEPDKAAA